MEIVHRLTVPCRDNGEQFTDTTRLEVIEALLQGSPYRCCRSGRLFRLYSRCPLEELEGPLLLLSTHVDCHRNITRCFSRELGELLQGTYDNALTNAAAVELMRAGALPRRAVVAFTGDEEQNSGGALEVARLLRREGRAFRAIVLDVTDWGWEEGADFTLENNFFGSEWGQAAVRLCEESGLVWRFVPADCGAVPAFVPPGRAESWEADPDETWDYDELGIECFSLCLPTWGEMHGDEGLLARKRSYARYKDRLALLAGLE